MLRIILSLIILLLGAAIAVGGVALIQAGGSWYYLALGVALIASGGLLLGRRPSGLTLYALTLVVTLIWSIWEVGFDLWALAPRGGLLFGLGLLLLLPWVVRGMRPRRGETAGYRPHGMLLGAAVAAGVVTVIYAGIQDPHDLEGAFAAEQMERDPGADSQVPAGEWPSYGRTSMGLRYSPLTQITPQNVGDLQVAWQYHTGDTRRPEDPTETTYEVTPLIVQDVMYLCTPHGLVIALDPVSGREKWRFDPFLNQPPRQTTQHMTCRGVSYYDGSGNTGITVSNAPVPSAEQAAELVRMSAEEVTTESAGVPQNVVADTAPRDQRNPRVVRETPEAVEAIRPDCVRRIYSPTADGRLIAISAETGVICPGFGGADGTIDLWANMPNVTPGSYYSTSPALITHDAIVVAGTVNDNVSTTSPSGVIRAFDINTGELRWNFDPKAPDATSPIAPDGTYSENTPNSWSVSSWDPKLNLIYVPMGVSSPDQYGGNRDPSVEKYATSVLALDAETGKPASVYQTVHHDLWDMDVPAQPSLVDLTIEGRNVPSLVVPTKQGEVFVLNRATGEPVLPVEERPAPEGAVPGDFSAPTQPVSTISFNPDPLKGRDMWGVTPIDQLVCRIKLHKLHYEGRYTPPSLAGSIIYPGNFGTFNWGGVAVDPNRQVLFGMPVYLAFVSKLVPRDDPYERVVTDQNAPVINENFGAPYAVELSPFLSPLGLPCQQPPWGFVAGVDLTTGKLAYRHVNGTVRDLSPLPLPFEMGVPGIGGPIVTKGGVVFLSGTLDYYVRGYDLSTGKQLWRARLPAGGQATPATYLGADGRQYLVVVAGGHGSTGTEPGDSVIAYALDGAD